MLRRQDNLSALELKPSANAYGRDNYLMTEDEIWIDASQHSLLRPGRHWNPR